MHMALRAMLAGNSRYSIVAAATTVSMAEQLVGRVRPALLVCDTDIRGESGLDLVRWTRQASPATHIVILTGRDEPLLVKTLVEAGAVGYLLKDSAPEVLAASLDQVMDGALVIDPRLGTSRAAAPLAAVGGVSFSRREREVLAELIEGLDNRSIALRLSISEETVKSHMKAILRKLSARDRSHAIAVALGVARPAAPSYPKVSEALNTDDTHPETLGGR